jgi:outer membrane lipoprotein-sorting protein
MNSTRIAPLGLFLLAAAANAKPVADFTASGTPEEKGQSIAKELHARNAGYKDLGADVEMTLKDASGGEAKRRFRIRALEQPDPDTAQYSLVVFDAPGDVKGTALLSHAKLEGDDDQWLFVPSVGRVKRVSSTNRSGAFLGSEFAYEDLTGGDARKHEWRYVGTAPCGTLQCLSLEGKPKDARSGYSKRVLAIDTAELRVQSIDFFDRTGARIKTLSYDGYTKLKDRFWRAQKWTMKNHQSGKSTVLDFSSMRVDSGIPASDFSPSRLGGH